MEVRRAADLLCKSYASLSLSRTVFSSPRTSSPRIARQSIYQSRRQLSSQVSRRAPEDARKATSSADYNSDIYKSRDTGFLPPRKTSPSSTSNSQSRTTILSTSRGEDQKSSVDDFIGAATAAAAQSSRPGLFNPPTPSRFTSANMAFPTPSTPPASTVSKPRTITELPLHLKPRIGRTLAVNPHNATDLGAKIRSLDLLCNRNRVKQDANAQRFHERPGLRRKRLASLRWRRNFRSRFVGVCERVGDLRAQGW